MKNLELENCGLVEMNYDEMVQTDGGIAPLVAFGLFALCVWAMQGDK